MEKPYLSRLFVIHFKLYSRSYCHLCDDMLQALNALPDQHLFDVEVIDVDADDKLEALYDELVPVLVGNEDGSAASVQLCHYFLDRERVIGFLQGKA